MRNRIVAGMCEAVVVVESDVGGGSMITAKFAGDQGRLVFAVPGRIDQVTSAGCHQLIRDGATLLTSVDDIVSELNYLEGLRPAPIRPKSDAEESGAAPALDEAESAVLACFTGGAILSIDSLAAQTGRPAAELSAILMLLELKRRIVKRADGQFEART
jgi:DNA processing protein